MIDILNFMKEHWQLILAVVLFVLSFILQLLKKKPISDIETSIYHYCIQAILCVEQSDLKGVAKLDSAVMLVSKWLNAQYPNLDTGVYFNLIKKIIEKILETPQKKGGETNGK